MKFVLSVVVLVLVTLFAPSYELRVLKEPFSEEFRTVESFWLFRDKCVTLKNEPSFADLRPYCAKTTAWQSMRSTSSQYRKEREPSDLGI